MVLDKEEGLRMGEELEYEEQKSDDLDPDEELNDDIDEDKDNTEFE